MAPERDPTPESPSVPLDGHDLIQMLLAGHASLALWARHLGLLVQPLARVLGNRRVNTCIARWLRPEPFGPSASGNAPQKDDVDPAP